MMSGTQNGIQVTLLQITVLTLSHFAREKVVVSAIVTDKPCLEQSRDPVDKAIPGLYPACVVTRAMSKKKESTEEEVALADTIIGEALKSKPSGTLVPEPAVDVTEDGLAYQADKMSKPHLIAEQQRDPAVSGLFARVVDESEVSQNAACFFTKNEVLMRKWRPPDTPAEDEWAVKYQIVVPKSYRQEILSLAHETPLAGHMGHQ